MADPKKLITSFLLLALMAGSLTFVLGGLLDSKKPTINSDFEIEAGTKAENGQNNKSAFIETLIQQPEALVQNSEVELPPAEDPSNLTENLARKLTEKMATLNPEEGGLISDKVNVVTQDVIASAAAISNPQAIGEEINKVRGELEKESNDFKIIKNSSQEDVAQYIANFNEIIEQNFVKTGLSNFLSESSPETVMGSVELALDQTIIKTKTLKVPEPLANFHKSFLELILYQKNFLTLAQDQIDPVKTGLVFGLQEENYNQAIGKFEDEFKKAEALNKFSSGENQNGAISFLVNIFSIKKAHAFLGFGDIVFDIQIFARDVWKVIKQVITEKLKKKLIDMIVKQTTNWIQGGGKPKFVQDFPGFLKDAAVNTFSSAVANITVPGVLCSRFRGLIIKSFEIPRGNEERRTQKQFKCTLNEATENIKDFYDDFRAGGIESYIKVLKPQNNYFGVVIELSDLALAKSAKQAEAEQLKVGSSQGFLTTRVCKKRKTIDFIEVEARLGSLSGNDEEDAKAVAKMTGVDYIGPIEQDSDGLKWFNVCPQDGWEDTTPGKAVAETLDRALGAHLDWIVNSNDLIAIATAFVDSLINKMFQKGAEGLALVSNRRNEVEDYTTTCATYNLESQEYRDCVRDAQEINEINSVQPTSTLIKLAEGYREILVLTLAQYSSYLPEIPLTIDVLKRSLVLCADDYGPPDNRDPIRLSNMVIAIKNYETREPVILQQEINKASSSITWLNNFINEAQNTTSTSQVRELNQSLETRFDFEMLSLSLSDANERLEGIKKWRADINSSYLEPTSKFYCDGDEPAATG